MGFAGLAAVDRFLVRRRFPVLAVTAVAVVAAAPLLLFLRFDFNPLHLQNPNAPAVATFLKLRRNPQIGANAIEIMTPGLDAADALARRLAGLPQVQRASTLDALVPSGQGRKLQLIRDAAAKIGPSLHPATVEPAPTDAQNVDALTATAADLAHIAAGRHGSRRRGGAPPVGAADQARPRRRGRGAGA